MQAANAAWQALTGPFIGSIVTGPNASIAGGIDHAAPSSIPIPDIEIPDLPHQTEDCLFSDVMVSQSVFDAKNTSSAPVVLAIHGGGFVGGVKTDLDPPGLLAEGMMDGRKGFVFVSINYRLGLFGFPPKMINDTDTISNAGLFDQRLAIAWVQKYIHLFGGDPDDMTIMGESTGGASIMHHITAYGGTKGPLPITRAIIQSPAYRPAFTAEFYQDLYEQVLQVAKVTSYDEIRALNTTGVQVINATIVYASPFATFNLGTNIDDNYVPAPPTVLLATGRFIQNISLMVTHNSNEGVLLTDPTVNFQAAFETYLQGLAIGATNESISQLATDIYPEIFDGTYPWKTQTERVAVAAGEGIVENNAIALNQAFKNLTYGYTFAEFRGLHAQDLGYVYWNGAIVGSFGDPINMTMVQIIQKATVNFALKGYPNGNETIVDLPVYGKEAQILYLNETTSRVETDAVLSSRTSFWRTGLYADLKAEA